MIPDVTQIKTEEWMVLFKKVYLKKYITPYMHAFCSHLHQFQKLYGDINMFNLQGMFDFICSNEHFNFYST